MEQPEIKVGFVQTKSIMTKSNAPLGGYSVNPYVGCPHACRYCYASFMKRFTGHTEDWGTFMDVKEWPAIIHPRKYQERKNQRCFFLSCGSMKCWEALSRKGLQGMRFLSKIQRGIKMVK